MKSGAAVRRAGRPPADVEGSADIFRLLAGRLAAPGVFAIREAPVHVPGGTVAHALDPEGRPALLIPLQRGDPVVEDTTSRGVTLRHREYLDAGVLWRYLVVRCESAELQHPFAVFTDEVLSALEKDSSSPQVTCQVHLDRWRDLLAPARTSLLGAAALAGLLAELHVLERLSAIHPGRALDAWTGPEGGRHDFNTTGRALEVKATLQRERFAVEIHGVKQLETPPASRLLLYAEQLETGPVAGDTVPACIDRLLGLGVQGHRFFEKLALLGYQPGEQQAYQTVHFSLTATRLFEVSGKFPRIVPASLTEPAVLDRIQLIRYTIDLSDSDAVTGALSESDLTDLLLSET